LFVFTLNFKIISLGRQLIQQLQLIGEVVYLRDECKELDYIV